MEVHTAGSLDLDRSCRAVGHSLGQTDRAEVGGRSHRIEQAEGSLVVGRETRRGLREDLEGRVVTGQAGMSSVVSRVSQGSSMVSA